MHSLASSSSLHSKQPLNEPLVLIIKSFIGESNRDQTTGLPVLGQAHKPPKAEIVANAQRPAERT